MAARAEDVKKLRELTGAPMMECKKALEAGNGNMEEAVVYLRKHGQATAAKKAGRSATQGLVGSYVHPGAQIGVIVEVNCESDFVARTADFIQMVHDVAMQICATDPRFIRKEDVPAEALEREKEILRAQTAESGKPPAVVDRIVEGRLGKFYEENCLYEQHFIKDQSTNITVRELIETMIGKLGENITVRRFSRFKVGDGLASGGGE
ncbi:MAG TPA: translation elongation factor Ts [Terriglobia bacterium]|nr:translation elongation factor Ts [Terriglobia bacterium]